MSPFDRRHTASCSPFIEIMHPSCTVFESRDIATYLSKVAKFSYRSEIWYHYRVHRPIFPIWRRNSGDSRTFKAENGILMFAWIPRTFWPKWQFLWQNVVGEGMMRCWSYNELVLTFGENRSRNATVRVHSADVRQTDTRCDRDKLNL